MRLKLALLSVVLFLARSSEAAHTRARLILSTELARPGETVLAGVYLKMDPNWHTYWRNAGDSGLATSIDWKLPEGVSTQGIQWPVPEKLSEEGLTTYIFRDEVVLLVPLKLAANLKAGPHELKARVSWLECEVKCVPGDAEVKAMLNIGPETKRSKEADQITAWQKKLPQTGPGLGLRAWWENEPASDSRMLLLEWTSSNAVDEADFFPYGSEEFEIPGKTEKPGGPSGKQRLRLQVNKLKRWPDRISGVLMLKKDDQPVAREIEVRIDPR
jgi:DsbC/DsbD-like thiol-disulfide interchange protein